MKCATRDDLLRYLANLLSADRARTIERHLEGCDQCARLRDELQALTRRLRPDPDEFAQPSIADEVMTLVRLGRARPRPSGRWWRFPAWWLVPAAAALGLLVVAVVIWAVPGEDPAAGGFQSRADSDNPDRWVSIKVFRAADGGYRPVAGRVRPDDALAFTYRNRNESYRYLMVLAVGARGQVFWYYPALTRPDDDPRGIPVADSEGQLPDEIRHALPPGALRLLAVFSADALRVSQVEATLLRDLAAAGSLERLGRLSLAATGQHSILLVVSEDE